MRIGQKHESASGSDDDACAIWFFRSVKRDFGIGDIGYPIDVFAVRVAEFACGFGEVWKAAWSPLWPELDGLAINGV